MLERWRVRNRKFEGKIGGTWITIKLVLILAVMDFLALGKINTAVAQLSKEPWTPTFSRSTDGPLKLLFLLVSSTKSMASITSKPYVILRE
jgi:hypothetical protein